MAGRLAARGLARCLSRPAADKGRLYLTQSNHLSSVTYTYGTPPSHGSAAATAVAHAAEKIITPLVIEHLDRHGYAVVDGALDGEATRIAVCGKGGEEVMMALSESLRRELEALVDTPGAMLPNATHLVQKEGTMKLEKSGIFEAEVHALDEETLNTTTPTFRAVLEDRSMLTLLNVMLPPPTPLHQLHYQSVKLQLNMGDGGCFPLHFDSDATVDGRRVTALTYLNPDWAPGDGGELVLYPFPHQPVKIEPIMGRVVLFSAANMLHRVLPSEKKRLCFTTWFFAKSAAAHPGAHGGTGVVIGTRDHGGGESRRENPGDAREHGAEPAAASTTAVAEACVLVQPHLRKHLMRVVYAEEWAQSIAAAHPESPARTAALETHWKEVEVISRVLAGKYPKGLELIARVMASGSKDDKAALRVTWF